MTASKAQMRATAERRVRLMAARAAGATFPRIAEELGYASPEAAAVDLRRALAARDAQAESSGRPVSLELERLDRLERAGQQVLSDSLARQDWTPALEAVDRLLKISRHRSVLLGFSAAESARKPPASRRDELADRRARRRGAAAAG